MKENPLRVWRREHKQSAVSVALKLDLSEQSVLSFEKGRFSPSAENFEKIATLMDWDSARLRLAWAFWRKGHHASA